MAIEDFTFMTHHNIIVIIYNAYIKQLLIGIDHYQRIEYFCALLYLMMGRQRDPLMNNINNMIYVVTFLEVRIRADK